MSEQADVYMPPSQTALFHPTEEMIAQEPILQFFVFTHLPAHLQVVSRGFAAVAAGIVDTLPRNPERTVALRKSLESKDAAVRAKLFKSP